MEPLPFLTDRTTRAQSAQCCAPPAFTIVEMLVVLAIIGIIMLVVISGQSSFSRTLLLTDTAYTVALSARESQVYGLSSHIFSASKNAAYGLYFTPNTTTYVQFADIYPSIPGTNSVYCPGHADQDPTKPDARPGNCLYDPSQGELVRLFNFGQGYSIGSITALEPGSQTIVSPSPVDITFQRPNTTAVLVGYVGSAYATLSEVHIRVSSPQGNTECVVITQLGEISVEKTCS